MFYFFDESISFSIISQAFDIMFVFVNMYAKNILVNEFETTL